MRIVKHDMTEELAVKLLGWKWISYFGQPTHDHESYPGPVRVRQLFSAKQLKAPGWIAFLDDRDALPADGTEPLSYVYDSSHGQARLPTITILVDE